MYGGLTDNLQTNTSRGLGISDLKLEGFTLLTRWLWLQKTDQERAWSELPIKTSPEVHAFFQASTYTVVGDG
jgi:hypothetical protein